MTIPEGSSVWQELEVADPAGVAEFYAAVLGWELKGDPESGTFLLDGQPVAGLRVVDPADGGEPGWKVYLKVDDLSASLGTAQDDGCVVKEADKRLILGDYPAALLTDPFGATIGLAQVPDSAAVPPVPVVGRLVLVDAMTSDVQRAKAWSDRLFGLPLTQHEEYFWAGRDADGHAVVGFNQLSAELLAVLPTHWLPWLVVDSVIDAVAATEATGGKVLDSHDFVFGTYRVLADPSGASFKALQLGVPEI